jgi:preprotein translocase subunit SecA
VARCFSAIVGGGLQANAPYAERADLQRSRVDAALLQCWGGMTARVLSKIAKGPLVDLARRAEKYGVQIGQLSDRALRESADDLRATLIQAPYGIDPVARGFALARESAQRNLGKQHYFVQMLGGAAMMRGALAEMQTGEGKTLTAILPAVTAALSGRPVHVITVNEYLARRDAEQLRPVYQALGITVGLVEHGQEPRERRAAYACDITYCTNKDLVFDYLRDRMALGGRRARARLLLDGVFHKGNIRQPLLLRGLGFAIVDEADSVLIDEARTPLILAGADQGPLSGTEMYSTALDVARSLKSGEDFHLLANENAIRMTADGESRSSERTKRRPGLWSVRRARNELIQQALVALHLFRKDEQYIVAGGKVQIVDEYTGRVMPDRSWERGLHQLIEAKEGCEVTQQNRTLARITYQRFFRRYLHLCGMTGTALEAAGELRAVYGLNVVQIPTNRPLRRRNMGTRMFVSPEGKWEAVVNSARTFAQQQRAVLIGTRSVAASELVGGLLSEAGLDPVVLNAREDMDEAEIVARAGQPARITVATNMAGRGTDIELQPAVRAAGGLHVILTEYHESSRIDRQLFGRAGRQGDPGTFESIVSLRDDLFTRFAGRKITRFVPRSWPKVGEISAAYCHLLRRQCQTSAERLHARTRRRALADDERFQNALSFAGNSE